MFLSHLSQLTTGVMVAVCLWAVVSGKWPERVCGVALAANWIGCAIGQDRRPAHHSQPVVFALDALLFLILAGVVVGCRRSWPLWACACALLLIFCHVTVLLDARLTQWSYMTVYYVWSLGVVLALGVGTAVEGRRSTSPFPLQWRGQS